MASGELFILPISDWRLPIVLQFRRELVLLLISLTALVFIRQLEIGNRQFTLPGTRHLTPDTYSYLSATIGSTFAARRAGR